MILSRPDLDGQKRMSCGMITYLYPKLLEDPESLITDDHNGDDDEGPDRAAKLVRLFLSS